MKERVGHDGSDRARGRLGVRRLAAAPLVAVLLFALALPGQEFDSIFESYLAGYWRANPVLATRWGVHSYDSRLPDFTPAALQAEIARQRDYLRQFGRLDAAQLAPGRRADLEVVLNRIRLSLLELEELQVWKTRPDAVVSALRDSVRDIVSRAYAPAERRFESADARLKLLPKVLQAVRANYLDPLRAQRGRGSPRLGAGSGGVQALDTAGLVPDAAPSEIATRAAIDAARSAAEFIEQRVPGAAVEQGASRKLQRRITRDAVPAAAAFRQHADWLKSDLLPRSRGSLFPPPDSYARWLRYYLGMEVTPGELLSAAEADLSANQQEMRRLAESVAPGRPLADVLQSPAGEGSHGPDPTEQELLAAYRAAAADARRFIEQKSLLPLPRADQLRIEAAPEGFSPDRSFLDAPGPFEPDLSFHLYVPNLDRLSPEAADDALRRYNSGSILLAVVHQLYPGHYVQLEVMNRTGSLPQKVFANPAFTAGWAQYCEQMMFDEGYHQGEARARLFQLWDALRMQAAAILDLRLRTGAASLAEAAGFLAAQAFETKEDSAEDAQAIALNPGRFAAEFAGKHELLRLREDLRQKQGPAFALREFHEQLLALGAPALPAARAILVGSRQ